MNRERLSRLDQLLWSFGSLGLVGPSFLVLDSVSSGRSAILALSTFGSSRASSYLAFPQFVVIVPSVSLVFRSGDLGVALSGNRRCSLLDFKLFVSDELPDMVIPHLNVFRLCMIDRISNKVDCAL